MLRARRHAHFSHCHLHFLHRHAHRASVTRKISVVTCIFPVVKRIFAVVKRIEPPSRANCPSSSALLPLSRTLVLRHVQNLRCHVHRCSVTRFGPPSAVPQHRKTEKRGQDSIFAALFDGLKKFAGYWSSCRAPPSPFRTPTSSPATVALRLLQLATTPFPRKSRRLLFQSERTPPPKPSLTAVSEPDPIYP